MFQFLKHSLIFQKVMISSINERQLRVFTRVATSQSLREASRILNMSVSTVSRLISSLEHDAGVNLFNRDGYRLTLSEDGMAFYQQAQEILAGMNQLSHFKEYRQLYTKKPLHIATFPRQAETLLVPAFNLLTKRLPQFQLTLDVHISRDFWQSKFLHPFDIGFGNYKRNNIDNLLVKPLGTTPLVVCVPEGNPLQHKDILSPNDLINEKFILLTSDTAVGSTVNRFFPFVKSSQIVAISSNTSSALAMVSLGMGIHVTDALGAQSACLKNAKVVPLTPETQVIISAFWPSKSLISEETIKICCEAVRDILKQSGGKLLS